MSQKYEKLKSLLKELFQLDQPDLDFGLYRIMHAKATEVTQFLDRDLLPQVKQEFGQYKTADKAELEQQLAKAIEQAQALGADPEALPKVKELRAKIGTDAVDIATLEGEVYDHLINFFSRYYSEGDFLSKRRYSRDGRYAIPYDGEEVKLHWANHDQYYIKTSEYLRDYAFRLNPSSDANPMRVHFRLMDAAEGEHGNIKAANGKDRVFILTTSDFALLGDNELSLGFEYRPATLNDWPEDVRQGKTKPPAQKDLTDIAEKRILAVKEATLLPWIAELAKPHFKADGEKADYSRLRAHLNRYVARNTFDYFIHKDLGSFLRRELDFYIKNEVMHLDDVQDQTVPRVEQYLSKIKVIRGIASKIIGFLAQLEDFQKTLWLKKKFVVETTYHVSLKEIPVEFYNEIASNNEQIAEWKALYGIEPLTVDNKSNRLFSDNTPLIKLADKHIVPTSCMINSRHFSIEFTERLLDALGDLDEKIDGLLFHSENYQALRLMNAKFRERVKCIYIDPPYNTGQDDFPYKDSYQHSSWMCMMLDRAIAAQSLLTQNGLFGVQIGDEETANLRLFLDGIFAERKNSTVVRRGVKNVQAQFDDIDRLTLGHDIIHFYTKSRGVRLAHLKQGLDEEKAGKWDTFWRGTDRPTMRYDLFGQNPSSGQWRWEEGRAKRANRNYETYLHKEAASKSLDEWYVENLQCGTDLDFVRLNADNVVQYYVPPQSSRLVSDNWLDIPATGTLTSFPHEKSLALLQRIISWSTSPGDWVLDYFGGSGSVGHAAFSMPPIPESRRKFILVEMGAYFDEVLLPRVLRYAFSSDWKDGKPKQLPTVNEVEGAPRVFKIVRLESYEDTINNLEVKRSATQQSLLDHAEAAGTGKLREHYLLKYMLKVETNGSPSLLNVSSFSDPTDYRLVVKRPGSDESRDVCVDLIETFNWLLGLTVQHIAVPQVFSALFERDAEKRLQVKGRVKTDKTGPFWFRTVTGTMPDGRKVLVIWRKLTGKPEEDNLILDEWFTKQGYSSKDSEFGLIYVNGGNNLENLKTPDDTWKVRLIEDDFQRLMFATEGN